MKTCPKRLTSVNSYRSTWQTSNVKGRPGLRRISVRKEASRSQSFAYFYHELPFYAFLRRWTPGSTVRGRAEGRCPEGSVFRSRKGKQLVRRRPGFESGGEINGKSLTFGPFGLGLRTWTHTLKQTAAPSATVVAFDIRQRLSGRAARGR